MNTNKIIKMYLLLVGIILIMLFPGANAGELISTNAESFFIDEPVMLVLDASVQDPTLIIRSPTSQYRYLGYEETITFFPKDVGVYEVELLEGNNHKETISFTVYVQPLPQIEDRGIILLDAQDYKVNEPVIIGLSDEIESLDYLRLEISSDSNQFVHMGLDREISFVPRDTGYYVIRAYSQSTLIDQQPFFVFGMVEGPHDVQETAENVPVMPGVQADDLPVLQDDLGETVPADIFYYDNETGNTTNLNESNFTLTRGKHHVVIYPRRTPIVKMDFPDLEVGNQNQNMLHLNEIFSNSADNRLKLNSLKNPSNLVGNVYSIDPAALNFTNATITVRSRGTELYKCEAWNFSTQTCEGNWTKLKDIIPGEEYNITLTPGDPGFAEILITQAQHLDVNKLFVSNIFEEVRRLDGNWSEPIYHNEFVRVVFEKPLTPDNDISLYVRNNQSLNTTINVYYYNTTQLIAQYPILEDEQYYKILLKNITSNQAAFDLQIVNLENNTGAYIEIDHIIDPTFYFDPSGDVTTNWDEGTSQSYVAIDNGVRYPSTTGITADYVADYTQGADGVSEFAFPEVTYSNPQYITLWVYTGTGGSCSYTYYLQEANITRCSNPVGAGSTNAWTNCNWTTPVSSYNNLTIELSAVSKGAGGHSTCYVYEAYLEVSIPNEDPNVTLIYPPTNQLMLSTPIDFNFSVTDAESGTITSCAMYDDFAGSWAEGDTLSSISNNTEVNFTISPSDGTYIWNVLCTDIYDATDWGDSNYSVRIDTTAPTSTLNTPLSGGTDTDGNVTLICTGSDGTDVANISLWHNVSGNWTYNQTVNFTNLDDTSAEAQFNLTNIPINTFFEWNCLVTDIANRTDWGDENYTLLIDPFADAVPVVSLNEPPNGATMNNTFTIDFNCSATDNNDIVNLNLFTNKSGVFNFEQTQSYPGATDTSVSKVFTVSGFTDNQQIGWNCKAIDNSSQEVFYYQNYSFTVDQFEPNVTLIDPPDQYVDIGDNINISFTCNVSEESDIVNVSFYHNLDGNWKLNQTVTYGGSSDLTVTPVFNLTNLPQNSFLRWNCLAYDNDSLYDWATANYSVSIPPEGVKYFAKLGGYGGTWNNPDRATLEPDGSTANAFIDADESIYTFNYSGMPNEGYILGTYMSMNWYVDTAPSNDDFRLSYSNNNGSTWYNLDGTAYDGSSVITTWPSFATNLSYEITSGLGWNDYGSLQLRAIGDQDGGPDGTTVFIDSIFLSVQFSPPPTVENLSRNESSIYENNSVTFNSTWTDDTGLGCFIFSINQSGTWWNSTCTNLDGRYDIAEYSKVVNATAGTTVQWMFWANDTWGTFGSSTVQSFVVSDAGDLIYPVVHSINVTPKTNSSFSLFNITANITDNIGVNTAFVEVTDPGFSDTNYSLSQLAGGDIWTYAYTGTLGGNYSFIVYGIDGAINANVSATSETFNVTPILHVDKEYYGRGETVFITGEGFTAFEEVELDIQNISGTSVSGFPGNTTSISDGNISDVWTIPSGLTFQTGNYSLDGFDTSNPALTDSEDFVIIVRPSQAFKVDDNFQSGTIVRSSVNESDDINTTIYANGNDDYVNFTFSDNIPAGYVPLETYFYLEHLDYGVSDVYVDIISAGSYVNVCTFSQNTTDQVFDTCNVSAYVTDYASGQNVYIRVRSDGTGAQEDFTTIDAGFLSMSTTLGSAMTVTITEPENEETLLDYKDTINNRAYNSTTTGLPPIPQETGTAASASQYNQINVSDASRWHSYVTTIGQHIAQSFYFTTSLDVNDINSLNFYFEGYATRYVSQDADDFRIYAWNYNTAAYDVISSDPISGQSSDISVESVISATPSNYINATNGEMIFTVIGATPTANPAANVRADLFTNYVSLTVGTIPTIGGNQYINATGADSDGVKNCTYFFTNSTGVDFTTYNMTNVTSSDFYAVSDTTQYEEGNYNITVNCTDPFAESNTDVLRVRVNNQAPTILLVAPTTGTNYTATRNVTLVWNATVATGNPLCDVYMDGSQIFSNVVSNNGYNTSRNETDIFDGTHSWYVTCENSAMVSNTSETRSFSVDLLPPNVSLTTPANKSTTALTTIEFGYTPEDAHNISACDLYVDGAYDQTNSTVYTYMQNNFTVSGFTTGTHNWSVNCSDVYGWQNTSYTNIFYVDTGYPWITLQEPPSGDTFIGGYVQFNFTAYDGFDPSMMCNITVDGFVEDENVSATNATDVIRYIELGDGLKFWNVSCWDDAGNLNTSETWNLTVQGAPTVNLVSPSDETYTQDTNFTFIYFAEDSDGFENCTLRIDGIYNQTNGTGITNPGNNNFSVNFTEENHYNWSVQCFDITDRNRISLTRDFYIDYTDPNIVLQDPVQGANLSSGSAEFNFTVYENMQSSLKCNLTVNDAVTLANTNFTVTNGSLTTRNQTNLPDGTNFWNVTCWDNAGNINTSSTRSFFVGGTPEVLLNSPANQSYRWENVTFNYTPTDSLGFVSCSLYINGLLNQTNTTIVNAAVNNFTVNNLPQQTLNWNVSCINPVSNTGYSTTRMLHIDATPPTVTLNYPQNDDLVDYGTINFNFTASDNNDTLLDCDLYLDSSLNESGIIATSGVDYVHNITGIVTGPHNWTTYCVDNSGNTYTALTYNFTIPSAPYFSGMAVNSTLLGYNQLARYSVNVFDDGSTVDYVNGTIGGTTYAFTNDTAPSWYYDFTCSVSGDYNLTYVGANNTLGVSNFSVVTGVDLECDAQAPVITYPRINDTSYVPNNTLVTLNASVVDPEDNLDVVLIEVTPVFAVPYNITPNQSGDVFYIDNFTLNENGTWRFRVIANDTAGNNNWSNLTDGGGDQFIRVGTDSDAPYFSNPQVNGSLLGINESARFSIDVFDTTSDIAAVLGTIVNLSHENYTLYNVSFSDSGADEWYYDIVCNASGYQNFTYAYANDTTGSFNETNISDVKFLCDASVPSFTNYSLNVSSAAIGQSARFSLNVYDDDTNVSFVNGTIDGGTYNFTNAGGSVWYYNYQCAADGLVNFTNVGANDTANNWNDVSIPSVSLNCDATPPSIALASPINNSNVSRNVYLKWTANDDSFESVLCNVSLGGGTDVTNINVTGGSLHSELLENLAISNYTWNVTCWDGFGNTDTTATRNFEVFGDIPFIESAFLNESLIDPLMTVRLNATVIDAQGNNTVSSVNATFVYPNGTAVNVSLTQTNRSTSLTTTDQENSSVTFLTNNTWEQITYDDFEAGYGSYQDGGSDSIRSTARSYCGSTYSVNLRDNTGSSNIQWSPGQDVDTPDYEQLMINYYAYYESIEPGEYLDVRFEGNVVWSFFGDGFEGSWLNQIVYVNESDYTFDSSAVVRFEAEFSTNFDDVWLDCINVSGSVPTVDGINDYTTYTDVSNITNVIQLDNISVTINVSTFTNTVSSGRGNDDPDIELELFNGSSWIALGNFSVTSTGVYSISTTEQSLLTAWLNISNRDVRVRGVSLDSNLNISDQITYGDIDVYLEYVEALSLWEYIWTDTFHPGLYNVTDIYAVDDDGKLAQEVYDTLVFTVRDNVEPDITLHNPEDDSNVTTSYVNFNWTATDNFYATLLCNLSIDGVVNASNINVTSGSPYNLTIQGFDDGNYTWNVTCWDSENNTNTSSTYTFHVQQILIDLYVLSDNISFSTTVPVEGENVTIQAVVFHNGSEDANDTIVQFWNGDPDGAGTQINSNITVNLIAGQNVTVNTTWIATQGLLNLYVLVDPPYGSGAVIENNETNNKANRTLLVSVWQTYYGSLNATVYLADSSNNSVRLWYESNLSGNLYVADVDDTGGISFTSLQTAYRNTTNSTNANTQDDFEDIDLILATENYSDNVNTTFSLAGPPRQTRTWSVYGKDIQNVAWVNSTNESAFFTGIMWDTSDSTNDYYDTTEEEDLVFVSNINMSQQGKYGIYDYEIKVPGNMRNYKGAEERVVFYYELQ